MKFKILLVFYRNIFWLTGSISLFICFLFLQSGDTKWLGMFIWTKVIINTLTFLFFHLFSKQKLYFFHNLGYTTLRLYVIVFGFDLFVWVILMVLTSSLL